MLAAVDRDLDRFDAGTGIAFREWRAPVGFAQKGQAVLMLRAVNWKGEGQPATADWNPAGDRRHAVESIAVTIA